MPLGVVGGAGTTEAVQARVVVDSFSKSVGGRIVVADIDEENEDDCTECHCDCQECGGDDCSCPCHDDLGEDAPEEDAVLITESEATRIYRVDDLPEIVSDSEDGDAGQRYGNGVGAGGGGGGFGGDDDDSSGDDSSISEAELDRRLNLLVNGGGGRGGSPPRPQGLPQLQPGQSSPPSPSKHSRPSASDADADADADDACPHAHGPARRRKKEQQPPAAGGARTESDAPPAAAAPARSRRRRISVGEGATRRTVSMGTTASGSHRRRRSMGADSCRRSSLSRSVSAALESSLAAAAADAAAAAASVGEAGGHQQGRHRGVHFAPGNGNVPRRSKRRSSSVALKTLKNRRPTPQDLSTLNNEYHILTRHLADCSAVRGAMGKTKIDDRDALLLEWAEGVSLVDWGRAHPVRWPDDEGAGGGRGDGDGDDDGEEWKASVLLALRVARAVAGALSEVHSSGVIHNDVSAENFIVDFRGAGKQPPSSSSSSSFIGSNCVAPDDGGETGKAAADVASEGEESGGDGSIHVKVIDLGFASPIGATELNDVGDEVNDDLYALGEVFRGLFGLEGAVAASGGARNSFIAVGGGGGDDRAGSGKWDAGIDGTCGDAMRGMETEEGSNEGGEGGGSFRCHSRSARDALCKVVTDLMEIGAVVDRYTSAKEVEGDLAQMLDQPERFLWDDEDGGVSIMKQPDFCPHKLYGRDSEVSDLLDAFRRVASGGAAEMVLVSGYSGTGKSTLVRQVQNLLVERGGYFISGKFDQLRRVEPFSAVVSAFTELCDCILAEDDEKIRIMSGTIAEAVGDQGKVLADLVPRLIPILGEEAATHEAPPVAGGKESLNRLNFVFRQFARAISSPDHPVVLFLDDLQWADAASLDLLRSLATDAANTSLLLVGCYRDNEVGDDHPLSSALADILSKGSSFTRIEVSNLDPVSVNGLVSDALRMLRRLTAPLSETVHRKTHGNAFYVIEFLKSLHSSGILRYSGRGRRWSWDADLAARSDSSDNVVDLVTSNMRKMDRRTRDALRMAAAVGSEFDRETLEMIVGGTVATDAGGDASSEWYGGDISVRKTRARRWSYSFNEEAGCDLGKILADLERAELVVQCSSRAETKERYRFAHDRIQQAAYSLIPDDDRGIWHLRIGEILLNNVPEDREIKAEFRRIFFAAVDHLNRAQDTIEEGDRKCRLAKLNLRAGKASMASSAFVPAASYLREGIQLLNTSLWSTEQYDLSLRLYTALVEAEYCNGHFVNVEQTFNLIVEKARSFKDKLRAYSAYIKALGAQGNIPLAIETGFYVLSQLGESFPQKVGKKAIFADLIRTKMKLRGKSDNALSKLPEMQNKTKIAAMKVLCSMFSLVYIGLPELVPLVSFRMVRLSLRYGLCKESSFGFAAFACILGGVLGDHRGAYRFGQLGLSFLERFRAKEWHAHVHALVYVCINVWVEPCQSTLEPLLRSHRVGMEYGDIEYAMYCSFNYCIHSFQSGVKLKQVEEDMRIHERNMIENGQDTPLSFLLPFRQAVLNLMEPSANPTKLSGEAMDQGKMLQMAQERKNSLSEAYIHANRLCLAYLFGDYDLAGQMLEKTTNFSVAAQGKFEVCTHTFYSCLTGFALSSKTKKKKWKKHAKKEMRKLKKWSAYAPQNCSHKLLLVQGEQAALTGNIATAKRFFDSAVNVAKKNGFVQDEALSYERAATHFYRFGDQKSASRYLARAHALWLDWGARTKADKLNRDFASLVSPARKRESFKLFLRGRSVRPSMIWPPQSL